MPKTDEQLSFDVECHPRARDIHGKPRNLWGRISCKVDVPVGHNLQPGDKLTIVLSDADGQVLNSTIAEVEAIAFEPVKDKRVVIGTERVHKAKVID